jgi:hypothetical protein
VATYSDAGVLAFTSTVNLTGISDLSIFATRAIYGAEGRWWLALEADNTYGTQVLSFSTAGVYSVNYSFKGPAAISDLAHDGTTFQTLVGKQVILHSAWVWTTESAKYWIGYTWYEDRATVGTREATDYETPISAAVSKTMTRRAYMEIAVPDFPSPASGGTMKAAIHIERGATLPAQLDRQTDSASKTTTLAVFTDSNIAPRALVGGGTTSVFPTGAASELRTSNNTPLLRSNGLSRVKLTKGGGQTPASNTDTSISWDSEAIDTDGYWTSGPNVTIPFTGQYLAIAGARWAANANNRRTVFVERSTDGGTNWNPVAVLQQSLNAVVGALGAAATYNKVDDVVDWNAGDLIRVRVNQDSGGPLNLNGGSLDLVFLGPS